MANKEYKLNDIVQMKKPHACRANRWQIIRMGADIKIKCMECTRIVMLSREKFEKGFKKVLVPAEEEPSPADL